MGFSSDQKIEIVCEQMRLNLSHEEVYVRHGVKKSTLYYWKNKYFPTNTEDKYEERKSLESIRVETVLTGINKDYFLADCKRRDCNYFKLVRDIISIHYSIMSNRPELQGKEMTEVKKYIIDRIKL